jgi:hypothetical protein
MESKQHSLFSNSLIYGLLTAAISIVFSVITYIVDVPFKSPVMYFSVVIMVAGIIYGTLQYRNISLGGKIDFGKAFVSGLLIVLVASVLSSIYSYLFFALIDPVYHERIIQESLEQTEAKLIEQGLSGDQMESALAMTRKFMSPIIMAIMALVFNTLLGAILALIAAAFLKKEDKSFNAQFKDVQ